MQMLSPFLCKDVPHILCGDMNAPHEPEHRYYYDAPHVRPGMVNKEETATWKRLVADTGGLVEAPGDGSHSLLFKNQKARGKASDFM